MTEEKARHYAEVRAQGMGITFYVVRSREGRFLGCNYRPTTAKSSRRVCRPPAGTTVRNSGTDKSGALLEPAQQTGLLAQR